MLILHLDGMALDCDTTLALQVHVVKHLAFSYLDCLRTLQQSVGKCRLAVVDVGNNTEIPYIVH